MLSTKTSRGFPPPIVPPCVSLLVRLKRTWRRAPTYSRLNFDELAWNATSPLIQATINDTRHVMQFLGHSGEVSTSSYGYLLRPQVKLHGTDVLAEGSDLLELCFLRYSSTPGLLEPVP